MSRWHLDWHQDWHLDWFGVDEDPSLFPGYGTTGPLLPALLENGYTVTLAFRTDVIKTESGYESSRTATLDLAKESYAGAAVLLGDQPVEYRTMLAEHAAGGGAFLLPLPHEELSVESVAGAVLTVPSTSLCDWLNPGQRVIVTDEDTTTLAVVQAKTGTTITIDTAPGVSRGRVMPVRQVLLDPQQDFPRYPVEAEVWNLQCRSAIFGFAPGLASLDLGDYTVSDGLANAVVTMRTQQQRVDFALDGEAGYPDAGQLIEVLFSGIPLVLFRYKPGTTTIGDLVDALAASTYVNLSGATNLASALQAGDEMGESIIDGGGVGPVGTGATLTTYNSKPVWDYEIAIEGTNSDGVHAMTTIIDYGAVPYAIGSADKPDWYRSIRIHAGDRADWQWIKLFLATVKGRQNSFWLPTWRADLGYVSHTGDEVTVTGQVSKWWPRHRQHVQIQQADGTVTYAEITAVSGQVITLSESLSGSAIEMISWLEECRFERDEFEFVFGERGWEFETIARVVES